MEQQDVKSHCPGASQRKETVKKQSDMKGINVLLEELKGRLAWDGLVQRPSQETERLTEALRNNLKITCSGPV